MILHYCLENINWPRREKTCLRDWRTTNAHRQPAHPRNLISAFVIRLLKGIISNFVTARILLFSLVSVAEQAGLCLTLSHTSKTGFLATSFKADATKPVFGVSD